jgi:membrane peptidoglycan carboxypeptidase
VYPAHDDQQRHGSTIAQQKARNAHLGGSRTQEEVIKLMA